MYYVKYFWFIAWNWGLRLAAFTIHHEMRGEKKYGINTSRIQDPKRITVKGDNLKHAEMYQGASYYLLEKVFEFMQSQNARGLIDFGAGKGRAMVVAAAYGYKKIVGVDFAAALCREAEENIQRVQSNYPHAKFEVVHEDVVNYYVDDDVDTFFFFNPFNEIIMKKVLMNIMESVKRSPRKVFTIYINPQYKDVFENVGFKKIAGWKKLKYIVAEIYEKK